MASSALITKAKNEIVRMNNRARALRQKNKDEAAQVMQGVSVLAGAAAAALVDEKFPAEGEDTAEVFGMPANAIVGGGLVIGAALVKQVPYRKELSSFGAGMAATALYQLIRDNVDFAPTA